MGSLLLFQTNELYWSLFYIFAFSGFASYDGPVGSTSSPTGDMEIESLLGCHRFQDEQDGRRTELMFDEK